MALLLPASLLPIYCPVLAETYAVNTANVNSAMQLIRVADGAVTDIDDQPGMDALDLCGDDRERTTVQASAQNTYNKPDLRSAGCVAGDSSCASRAC